MGWPYKAWCSIQATIPGLWDQAVSVVDLFLTNELVISTRGRHPKSHQVFDASWGELVPDDVTVKMWAQVIGARTALGNYKPAADLLVLDGIPRTVEQAGLMDEHIEVLKIIHLVCNNETEMFDRLRRRALKENRHDDADEKVIRKRWDVYENETRPVLEHYSRDLIADVNSIGSPGQILHDILDYVVPTQDKHFTTFEG